jgi:hemin uptake protein HemP
VNQTSRPKTPLDDKSPTEQGDSSTPKGRYESDELFGDRKEILIVHNAEIYRLRRTRHDKLILYK